MTRTRGAALLLVLWLIVLLSALVGAFALTAKTEALQGRVLYHGIVAEQEMEPVNKVLNAAAMTYVAATLTAVLQLLYFLFRLGLLGGRDE